MKAAPEPVMSEVVRQRLETLLGEVPPRHALPDADVEFDRHAGLDPGSPHLNSVTVANPEPSPGRRFTASASGAHPLWRLVEFGKEHLAAVVLILLVGCGWTAYSLIQAQSTPIAAAAPPSVVATPEPTATPNAVATILVHVLGAVKQPGLVELAEGSRVADAIAAAGGLTGSADPGELNLAAVVADGSQVVIGTTGKPRGEVRETNSQGGGSPAGAATVSLNTATLAQLDALPGIGPVTAQKILDWRQQHGRFTAVTELQEVEGIGPKTYADLAPHVRV